MRQPPPQASPPLPCPKCASPLSDTAFRDTRLARCEKCGGTWLSSRQLEALKGQPIELSLLEGHTTHLCARCLTTLSCALLPGSIPVETCGTCRGVFFEAGELEEFLPPSQPAPPAPRPSSVPADSTGSGLAGAASYGPGRTFDCAKCQRRFPVSEGNALGQQLVCRSCLAGSDVQPHQELGAREVLDFIGAKIIFNPYLFFPVFLIVYLAGYFIMGPDFWPTMCRETRYPR